jgi:CheY-like chemotaxis protein
VVNRTILQKRLNMDGHITLTSANGQEAVELIEKDRAFDCILMVSVRPSCGQGYMV